MRGRISNVGNQVGGSAGVLLELRALVNALAVRVGRIETQNDAIVARVDNPGVQAAGAQAQEPQNIAYQVVMQDGAEKVALEAVVETYRENWADWLNDQVKGRAEFDAIMATQARGMSEGMRILQARLYKTIQNRDFDNRGHSENLGFRMGDKWWVGVRELETWCTTVMDFGVDIMWNVIRVTEDYATHESAYEVLVINAQAADTVHVFVGTRHDRAEDRSGWKRRRNAW